MIIKLKPIEIDEENPFINDALKRKENAEILTEFIKSTKEPLVLALNSAWGTGKTTFIKMWQAYLHQNSFTTLYFNAWENDYCESPIAAFIGEIEESIKSFGNNEESQNIRHAFDKVKKAGTLLLKSAIPGAIKLGTMGLINIQDKDFEKIISDCAEKVASEQIKNYQESKKNVKKFKELLSEFATIVTKDKDKPERPPLVFFIDELDRCRPTFAIELLENVKHLFNIEGIVFVLSIDKNQLGHSIRSVYGNGMDVDGYLRRFIDIEYILPEPEKGDFVWYLFEKYEFDSYFTAKQNYSYESNEFTELTESCSDLFSLYSLSLREQEQIFSQISIVLKTTPNGNTYPRILVFLLCIRAKNKELYQQFLSKQLIDSSTVISKLKEIPKLKEYFEDPYGKGLVLEAYLVSLIRDKNDNVNDAPYVSILNNPNTNDNERNRAEKIKAITKNLRSHIGNHTLNYLIKKIEMLDKFKT